MSKAYERIVRPLLFCFDPETAHNLAIGCLRGVSRIDLVLRALRVFQPPAKPKTLFGLNFPNPVGLAAGFDKNGVALPAWAALGFGFIEIGTVTAKPQPGNPRPRMFRLLSEASLINRLGFNNEGADSVADELQRLRANGRWPAVPVGINIGKSRATPLEKAAEDYVYSFRRLHPFADYIALNVSSPNTPGLRSLQAREPLAILLETLRAENRTLGKPLILKVSPDLSHNELDQVLEVCEKNEIAGIIATNTTLDHSRVPSMLNREGGLSGQLLREKATAAVRRISARSKIPVIASGGVWDEASAREKIEAGAQLVQVYTGYIYRGPGVLREITAAF